MPDDPDQPHPVAAAIAVVENQRHVLLVRRRNPPDAGLWGFPGGKIEFGESIHAAAARELYEETGLRAEPAEVVTAVDVIAPPWRGHGAMHYILIAVRCHWRAGIPSPNDDALATGWFTPEMIDDIEAVTSYQVAEVARLVVEGRRSGFGPC
ncbi:NUDIX hydrolase [Spiribacter halobius]|uniref:NUDIX hydrolase n=1 Tax=Sediminicurvatus halobius TaxID=2182432 RepID=UPI001E647B18|nr:NUDIX hydrolase [Spiribacter halobius]UEX77672.1 NUDIX hydrolase [Spiribacter halobius]